MTDAPDRDPRRTEVDDPVRAVLHRILRGLLVATAVIGVLAVVVGLLVDGSAGLWGALLGVGVALVFCGTTALSMLVALHRPPSFLAVIVLGSWLVKMILLIVLLAAIGDLTFYNRYVFVAVLFAVVLASLVIDVRAVLTARIPHTGPAAGSGPTRAR